VKGVLSMSDPGTRSDSGFSMSSGSPRSRLSISHALLCSQPLSVLTSRPFLRCGAFPFREFVSYECGLYSSLLLRHAVWTSLPSRPGPSIPRPPLIGVCSAPIDH